MRMAVALAIIATTGATVAVATATATVGNETITYSYDARGRLIQVKHTGTVNNNVTSNFIYDKADNRTNVTITGAP